MKFKILLTTFFLSQLLFSQKSKLNVTIDERIETLYSVAYLNKYFLVNKHANVYKSTIDNKFDVLRNHRAVVLFDSISKNYKFSYYRPVEWILQYSEFPEFKKIKSKSDVNDETVSKGKEFLLEEFRIELIKFNQEELFQKYLNATKSINQKVIDKILESKTIVFLPDYLEEYYGTKLSSYNLILSPFLHSGGYNSEVINENGKKEVYAIIGPNGEIDFIPHFDKDYLETDMILHEFGHSFVNPLTEKFEKDIEKLKEKYYDEKLIKNGIQQGYSEWKYVFNELLLRSIVINITHKKFGEQKAKELLNFEKNVGFDLVEKVSEKLKIYEKNRKKFKTFEDFMPTLIKELN
jgi:hypothetical protein